MCPNFLRSEIVLWQQSKCHRGVSIVVLCLVLVAFAGTLSLAAAVNAQGGVGDIINRRDHQSIVEALESQVTLIQWIGGAIVTSLTAAVGLLFRALEKANAQARQDLVEGIKRREVLVQEVVQANAEVTKEVQSMNKDVRDLINTVRASR